MAMREVNTIRTRLCGNIVGKMPRFTNFDELAIYQRYEWLRELRSCGLENFLPPDTTLNPNVCDSSPCRRIVKGGIWAIWSTRNYFLPLSTAGPRHFVGPHQPIEVGRGDVTEP